ncbi:unnamed protein product, partial [marine sediment metagenome]
RKNLPQPQIDLSRKVDPMEEKLRRVPRYKDTGQQPVVVAEIRSRPIVSPALVQLGQQDKEEQDDELSDLSDFD